MVLGARSLNLDSGLDLHRPPLLHHEPENRAHTCTVVQPPSTGGTEPLGMILQNPLAPCLQAFSCNPAQGSRGLSLSHGPGSLKHAVNREQWHRAWWCLAYIIRTCIRRWRGWRAWEGVGGCGRSLGLHRSFGARMSDSVCPPEDSAQALKDAVRHKFIGGAAVEPLSLWESQGTAPTEGRT